MSTHKAVHNPSINGFLHDKNKIKPHTSSMRLPHYLHGLIVNGNTSLMNGSCLSIQWFYSKIAYFYTFHVSALHCSQQFSEDCVYILYVYIASIRYPNNMHYAKVQQWYKMWFKCWNLQYNSSCKMLTKNLLWLHNPVTICNCHKNIFVKT